MIRAEKLEEIRKRAGSDWKDYFPDGKYQQCGCVLSDYWGVGHNCFVAQSREDIAWLLAEVERLEDAATEELKRCVGICRDVSSREDEMRKDIHDMNSPAWGMATGAADAADEIRRAILGEDE